MLGVVEAALTQVDSGSLIPELCRDLVVGSIVNALNIKGWVRETYGVSKNCYLYQPITQQIA